MSVTSKLTRIIQLIRSLFFFRVDYKLLYKLYIPGYHLITKQTLISLLVSTQTHSSYFQRCAHVWFGHCHKTWAKQSLPDKTRGEILIDLAKSIMVIYRTIIN